MSEMLEVERLDQTTTASKKSLKSNILPISAFSLRATEPWSFICMLYNYALFTHDSSSESLSSLLKWDGTLVGEHRVYMFCIYFPPKIINKCEIQRLSYLICIMCESARDSVTFVQDFLASR